MKLLMISGDRSIAQGKSGAFSSMLQEFAKHWERIDIVCPRVAVQTCSSALPSNVCIHSSPSCLLLQPWFIRQKGIELHREYGYDVMTVHEYPPFYNGIGARLLRACIGIPMVMEIHHIVGMPVAASWSELVGRWMTRFFIRFHTQAFTAIRVVNTTVKQQLIAWGVQEKKIHLIPSVYLDHALVDITKHQEKKYDAVFAARLVDNKGLDSVIRAFSLIPQKTLCVIGDGPCRAHAEQLVDMLHLRDRVTFTGWLPTSEDVARTVASARLFILNSKSEGNPRSAVEAMAYGLPVITTRVGIMPDIVKEGTNGFFTDGTPEGIARAMVTVFHRDISNELLSHVAEDVFDQFESVSAIRAYAQFLHLVTTF